MTRHLVLRPATETDLVDIYQYIADASGSPDTAIRYVRRLRAYLQTLVAFPECGRLRNDLRQGIRLFGFERRVVIAYQVLPTGDIEIGRFFYGGRDYESLLADDSS